MQSRGNSKGIWFTHLLGAGITVSMLEITDNSNYDETFMYDH